jgi:hypothetical protein
VATNFTLTLDTTAPGGVALNINSSAPLTTTQTVTAQPSTSDGVTTSYQMKIWGNVDTTNDANVQATEGASAWVAYATTKSVKLSTGDGSKTLSLKIRDAAGNESSIVTKSITLDSSLPTPNITVAAAPTTISKIATFDTSTVTWSPDEAIQAYKVKVVPSTGSLESAGTLIPTTAGSSNTSGGSVAAAGTVTTTIKGTDLETASAGDGAKIVKIFIQDTAGNWSV